MLKLYDPLMIPVNLESEIIDGARFYWHHDKPELRLPSVTTVIGNSSITNKDSLIHWKLRVGERESTRISNQAKVRGATIHDYLEYYVKTGLIPKTFDTPMIRETFHNFKKVLDKNVSLVYGIEFSLWSDKFQTAGKTDLVAIFRDKVCVVDYKTSRKSKRTEWIKHYFVQSCCYGLMWNEINEPKVTHTVVIIDSDNEPVPQIFMNKLSDHENDTIDVFINGR